MEPTIAAPHTAPHEPDVSGGGTPAEITTTGEVVSPAAKPDLDTDLRAVWDRNHPNRWSDGKLALPDQTARGVDAEGAQAAATQEGADQSTPLEQISPPVSAPMSWSAAMKAKWSSLSPEVQTYVARRDKENHEAITRAGQYVKSLGQVVEAYEPLGQLIATYQDDFARRGIPPAQGIAVLLDAQRRLDANPLAGLVQIGLSYGIDLRSALQASGMLPQGGQSAPHSYSNPLQNELVQSMQDRLGLHERWIMAQQQAAHEAQNSEIQHTIAEFADGKAHFDEVRPLMAALLRGGQASDLADAYDMAVNAQPDIRRRIQADQRKAEEDRRAADARSKADHARRAASINVRSVPVGTNPRTIDDTLTEIARRRFA
jgi:hypothetical protein